MKPLEPPSRDALRSLERSLGSGDSRRVRPSHGERSQGRRSARGACPQPCPAVRRHSVDRRSIVRLRPRDLQGHPRALRGSPSACRPGCVEFGVAGLCRTVGFSPNARASESVELTVAVAVGSTTLALTRARDLPELGLTRHARTRAGDLSLMPVARRCDGASPDPAALAGAF